MILLQTILHLKPFPGTSEAMHCLNCVSRSVSYARQGLVALDFVILRHSSDCEICRVKAEGISIAVDSL